MYGGCHVHESCMHEEYCYLDLLHCIQYSNLTTEADIIILYQTGITIDRSYAASHWHLILRSVWACNKQAEYYENWTLKRSHLTSTLVSGNVHSYMAHCKVLMNIAPKWCSLCLPFLLWLWCLRLFILLSWRYFPWRFSFSLGWFPSCLGGLFTFRCTRGFALFAFTRLLWFLCRLCWLFCCPSFCCLGGLFTFCLCRSFPLCAFASLVWFLCRDCWFFLGCLTLKD